MASTKHHQMCHWCFFAEKAWSPDGVKWHASCGGKRWGEKLEGFANVQIQVRREVPNKKSMCFFFWSCDKTLWNIFWNIRSQRVSCFWDWQLVWGKVTRGDHSFPMIKDCSFARIKTQEALCLFDGVHLKYKMIVSTAGGAVLTFLKTFGAK